MPRKASGAFGLDLQAVSDGTGSEQRRKVPGEALACPWLAVFNESGQRNPLGAVTLPGRWD